jgi:uncharacterized FlgJ-related protein
MKDWIRDITISLFIFILGLCSGVFIMYIIYNEKIKELGKEIDNATYCISDSTDVECIKANFEKHHIRFSHIVLAQSILESNNYKSKICKTNHNIFGMKVPAQRFTFCNNPYDYGNYAKYDDVESCILDYKAWQQTYAYHIRDENVYFAFLAEVYAEDKNYVNKLKKIIENLKRK